MTDKVSQDLSALIEAADFPSPEEAAATDSTPAPAPAETPSAPAEAAPEAVAAAEPATPAERKAHEDFLAKHGGDPEKGAQHYFEVMGQNSKFAKENSDLQGRLAKLEEQISKSAPPAAASETPSVAAEAPALVKELDQVILDLSAEFGQVETSIAQIKDAHAKWTAHRDDLIERLATTTDPDVLGQLQQGLAKARTSLSTLESQGQLAWRDRQRLIRDYRTTDLNKRQAQQLHEESQSRASLESTSVEREVADYRKSFYSTAERVATAKGLPAEDLEDFKEDLGVRAFNKITQHGEFKSEAETEAFISALAERAVARARRTASSYATAKAADSKPAAPTGKAAVVPAAPKKSAPKTLDELSAHADDQWAQERI